jgi:hypothetical protein
MSKYRNRLLGLAVAATLVVFCGAARATGAAPGPPKPSPSAKKPVTSAAKGAKPAAKTTAARSKPASLRHDTTADDVNRLKEQLAAQQQQISQLLQASAEEKQSLDKAMQVIQSLQAGSKSGAPQTTSASTAVAALPALGQIASASPVIPALPVAAPVMSTASLPAAPPAATPAQEALVQKVDALQKSVDALNQGLFGFRFSGDFRLRNDDTLRSANSVTPSDQQNIRARYRLRFNVDKDLDSKFSTHFQLSTGTFVNPLTYDSDFTGLTSRGPIFLSEAWADYHPNSYVDLRGGKMSEVFADNAKFLMDDDVRFDGFHQIVKTSASGGSLGNLTLELRAGQYILSNPNVQVLAETAQKCTTTPQTITITTLPTTITINTPSAVAAACGWLQANFQPGKNIRDTDLFDQGFVLTARPSEQWTHQFTANIELWRNPNTIQLGSITAGFPLVVNPYYGLSLSGPITTGLGSATTTAGGGTYTAPHYQVLQLVYRADWRGWQTGRQGFPVSFEIHGARNMGTTFYNTAFMGQLTVGEIHKAGDVMFRYGYFYKPANSMISQVTDDDVGTNTTVNLRTNYIRFETGINRFVTWQNMVYIQDELAPNEASRHFFIVLPRGTATQYRVQSQVLFNF